MKRKVRFTFVFDRAARTAAAALIASVEVASGDDYAAAIRVNMHFLMPLSRRSPKFLSGDERRRLDRLAQQGIVRGHW